jgi:hypothetical protein
MVVETMVLSFVLAASPQRCEAGKRVFSLDGAGSGMEIIASGTKDSSLLYSASLEEALAKDLGLVPDVQFVCVERADNNLLVWVALDNPSEANRERVFQKQSDLIDGFPEVSFDFNIVLARSQDAREFVSDAKMVYSRG